MLSNYTKILFQPFNKGFNEIYLTIDEENTNLFEQFMQSDFLQTIIIKDKNNTSIIIDKPTIFKNYIITYKKK